MAKSITERVAALKTTPTAQLKTMWREFFESAPPPFNRRYLESRLAYRIQELAYGGLKRETVKRLHALGEQLDGGKAAIRQRRADTRPVAGTRLIKYWQDTPHEVIVSVDHFEYQGRRYKSLSAIASAITGTNRNGWTFFGFGASGGAR